MLSVKYHVTTPSTIYSCNATPSTIFIVAMATSAVSSSAAASSATSSRHQCVGRALGMLFEDVFELCGRARWTF